MVTNSSNNPLDRYLSEPAPAYLAELSERGLCGIVDLRGRVCAALHGHDDKHSFVPRTVRED